MRHESLRLAVAAAVLGTAPSFAATTYRVTFNGNDVFQSTPVSRAGALSNRTHSTVEPDLWR